MTDLRRGTHQEPDHHERRAEETAQNPAECSNPPHDEKRCETSVDLLREFYNGRAASHASRLLAAYRNELAIVTLAWMSLLVMRQDGHMERAEPKPQVVEYATADPLPTRSSRYSVAAVVVSSASLLLFFSPVLLF